MSLQPLSAGICSAGGKAEEGSGQPLSFAQFLMDVQVGGYVYGWLGCILCCLKHSSCQAAHSVVAALFAADLRVLGGLHRLAGLLEGQQPAELQEGAAYVLGTAASNNAKLVEALLQDHPDLIQQLLRVRGQRPQTALLDWLTARPVASGAVGIV